MADEKALAGVLLIGGAGLVWWQMQQKDAQSAAQPLSGVEWLNSHKGGAMGTLAAYTPQQQTANNGGNGMGFNFGPLLEWGLGKLASGDLFGGGRKPQPQQPQQPQAQLDRPQQGGGFLGDLFGGWWGNGATSGADAGGVSAGGSAGQGGSGMGPGGVNFDDYESRYNLPGGYLRRTAQIESAMNPNAKNPRSSAGGLFQFIDSTARQYGLTNRYDAGQATDAASRLARDNASQLRRTLGREPTGAELYLAHQQGGRGASRLLGNPNAPASSIVGSAAVRLNGGSTNMTAGEFAGLWINKYNRGV